MAGNAPHRGQQVAAHADRAVLHERRVGRVVGEHGRRDGAEVVGVVVAGPQQPHVGRAVAGRLVGDADLVLGLAERDQGRRVSRQITGQVEHGLAVDRDLERAGALGGEAIILFDLARGGHQPRPGGGERPWLEHGRGDAVGRHGQRDEAGRGRVDRRPVRRGGEREHQPGRGGGRAGLGRAGRSRRRRPRQLRQQHDHHDAGDERQPRPDRSHPTGQATPAPAAAWRSTCPRPAPC